MQGQREPNMLLFHGATDQDWQQKVAEIGGFLSMLVTCWNSMNELGRFHEIWSCVTYQRWDSKNQVSSLMGLAAMCCALKFHPSFLSNPQFEIL
jgi:hypothetical protein